METRTLLAFVLALSCAPLVHGDDTPLYTADMPETLCDQDPVTGDRTRRLAIRLYLMKDIEIPPYATTVRFGNQGACQLVLRESHFQRRVISAGYPEGAVPVVLRLGLARVCTLAAAAWDSRTGSRERAARAWAGHLPSRADQDARLCEEFDSTGGRRLDNRSVEVAIHDTGLVHTVEFVADQAGPIAAVRCGWADDVELGRVTMGFIDQNLLYRAGETASNIHVHPSCRSTLVHDLTQLNKTVAVTASPVSRCQRDPAD